MNIGDSHLAVLVHGIITDLHAVLSLHLKNGTGKRVAIEIHLGNSQRGALVVLEVNGCVAVRKDCDHLGAVSRMYPSGTLCSVTV